MIEQLILVRHGETVHNVSGIAQGWGDSDLSDRGQLQVARAAERLKDFAPDVIYTSPLSRAMSTAKAIRDVTGLDIQIIEDLREINLGQWEGQRYLDVRKNDEERYRRWRDEDDYPCPDGESHCDVLARIKRALESVNGAKRPVVVSHGTAIRVAATALLELPLSAARNFAQDNAALNVFLRRGDRWILHLWNDTTHCDKE